MDLDQEKKRALINEALLMRQRAYVPYSSFTVGAALLCDDGRIYGGCNIENASYPATICAERTAAVKAISSGAKEILALCVCACAKRFPYPCGVCRQFLNEFISRDIPVLLVNQQEEVLETTFYTIFPKGFQKEDME